MILRASILFGIRLIQCLSPSIFICIKVVTQAYLALFICLTPLSFFHTNLQRGRGHVSAKPGYPTTGAASEQLGDRPGPEQSGALVH